MHVHTIDAVADARTLVARLQDLRPHLDRWAAMHPVPGASAVEIHHEFLEALGVGDEPTSKAGLTRRYEDLGVWMAHVIDNLVCVGLDSDNVIPLVTLLDTLDIDLWLVQPGEKTREILSVLQVASRRHPDERELLRLLPTNPADLADSDIYRAHFLEYGYKIRRPPSPAWGRLKQSDRHAGRLVQTAMGRPTRLTSLENVLAALFGVPRYPVEALVVLRRLQLALFARDMLLEQQSYADSYDLVTRLASAEATSDPDHLGLRLQRVNSRGVLISDRLRLQASVR